MDWTGCLRDNGIATLNCVPVVITSVTNALFSLAAVTAVFFIVFSGIKFLTSGGDPVKVEQARRTITFAIIGLILVLMSFFIIKLISNVLNTDCINKFNLVNCQ